MAELDPIQFSDGLACYRTGQGDPLFLMPYPHGFGRAPIVQEPLAVMLCELQQQVIAFDPPGMFNTTRPAQVSMPEMISCAEETLSAWEITEPLTLVGHSMGIHGARLIIFERSGHYPFIEERELFKQTLADFLA